MPKARNFVVYDSTTGVIAYQIEQGPYDPDIVDVWEEYNVIQHPVLNDVAEYKVQIIDNTPTVVKNT